MHSVWVGFEEPAKAGLNQYLLGLLAFLFLAATGSAFLLGKSSPLGETGRMMHLGAGLVFAVGLVIVFALWVHHARLRPGDWQWLRHLGGYLGFKGKPARRQVQRRTEAVLPRSPRASSSTSASHSWPASSRGVAVGVPAVGVPETCVTQGRVRAECVDAKLWLACRRRAGRLAMVGRRPSRREAGWQASG